MKFYEVVDQVAELLQRRGRVAYRALKVEFELNDEQLTALKEELIDIQEITVDKDNKMLVWTSAAPVPGPESRVLSATQPLTPSIQRPISYTPPHLAERIRAEQAALEARGATDGEPG